MTLPIDVEVVTRGGLRMIDDRDVFSWSKMEHIDEYSK